MVMDETLYGAAEKVQNFAVIYLVDITAVPDFNKVSSSTVLILISDSEYLNHTSRCMSCTIRVRLCSSIGTSIFFRIPCTQVKLFYVK